MVIAYLILAHNTPNHLRRLIRALDSPEARFFVHVDRKADLAVFRRGLTQSNVVFIADRVAVYWGEFSQVSAIICLLRESQSSRADYFCLLSGSDYPLRGPRYIQDFFARHQGREFMNLVPIPCPAVGKLLDRVEQYRFQTPWNGFFAIRVVARLNDLLNRRLQFSRNYSRALHGLRPYGGSTWWALTNEACRHILDFIDDRPDVVRFFTHGYLPDESFFQTIIGNSPFAARVDRNLTFADWSRPGGGPAVIDADHLDTFLGAEAVLADDTYGRGELLFARKFPDDSAWLTDRLDARIRGQEGSAAVAAGASGSDAAAALASVRRAPRPAGRR